MILASDLLVYLYLSKGRNWRLGLHFPKRLLLHFCLSISIISKISQSQTTRVTARPFVSFASAKVGKNHPNFQISTQIHTTTRRFPQQFAHVHYLYVTRKRIWYFFRPIHLTPHLSGGPSIHCGAFIRRSLRMRLCRESYTLFRVLRHRIPSSPIYLSEVVTQALRLIARIPLIQRRKKHRSREGKSAFT